MMKKRSLAVLCDYGLDDMIATLYLLENASPFETIDILPVAGNFLRETSARNANRILSHCDKLPAHVRLVDTSSLPQHGVPIPEIHGKDGIGDFLPPFPDTAPPSVPLLSYPQWLSEVDDTYTILSLGPCTVTADILKQVGPRPLILMAGNIAEPPNFHTREFNHELDVPAFAACVTYPHVAATLDSCHHPLSDFYQIRIDDSTLLGRAVKAAVTLSRQRGEPACRIYDLSAAVYLIHPDRFDTETLCDPDGNTVTVLRYRSSLPLL